MILPFICAAQLECAAKTLLPGKLAGRGLRGMGLQPQIRGVNALRRTAHPRVASVPPRKRVQPTEGFPSEAASAALMAPVQRTAPQVGPVPSPAHELAADASTPVPSVHLLTCSLVPLLSSATQNSGLSTSLRSSGAGPGGRPLTPGLRLASGVRAPERVLDQGGGSPLQAYAPQPVTKRKGVVARRGPEQLEVNYRSAG